MLTSERLKEVLRYCPDTGEFIWCISAGSVRAGCVAGAKDNKGYVVVRVDGVLYKAHRLSFLYMVGEWPTEQVDHLNRDKSDNRWVNLDSCSNSENHRNVGIPSNNTSGYLGVSWCRSFGKWRASITIEGRKISRRFTEKSDAIAWRREQELLGGYIA